MQYTNLLSPIQIGSYTYKNRIVTAPMVFALLALNPAMREAQYCKIESRARGGAGAVTVGEVDVNFTTANRVPFPPCDFEDFASEAFSRIAHFADLIHANGAVALIELLHPGAEKNPFPGQPDPVGPVSYIKPNGVQVKGLDEAGMETVAADFAKTARFLIKAGFDGVTIHGGHGFILTQFLSPVTNTRTDEYGGSLENRAKFPARIIRAVREAIGPDHILDLRISGREGIPGGMEPEETARFCQMVEEEVDSFHMSSGLYYDPVRTHQFSSMFHSHGINADDAAVLKRYVRKPVGVVGGINSPEQAEEILEQGKADFIIIGRQSIADPDFANKTASGRADLIHRCVRCYSCFPGSPEEGYNDLPPDSDGSRVRNVGYCAVNPAANHPPVSPAKQKKTVLVVGGGVAGMQAAITLCARGHRVVLAERDGRLGGALNFTDVDVDKEDLRNVKNVIVRETMDSGAEIRLNTNVDKAIIDEIQPDCIIISIGAHPIDPPIPGIGKAHRAVEVYEGLRPGKTVLMIGGGLVGCETALHLSKCGHTVTVVEQDERIARDSYGMYREALLLEMEKCGITCRTGAVCREIREGGAIIEANGCREELEADTVLYALGMTPNDLAQLEHAAGSTPVYVIGDSRVPGKVGEAMKAAYELSLTI